MPDDEFAALVSQSLRLAPASAGANLTGFALDLAHALEQRAMFSGVRVKKTGDQRCMLRATCIAQPAVDVTALLLHIWEDDLRYAAYAARRVIRHGQTTELAFVTRSDRPDPLCVTGLISVAQPDAGQLG